MAQVAAQISANLLLGCRLDNGDLICPAWQFRDDGATLPGLPDVLKILSTGTGDPRQIALWLSAPSEDLDGMSARDWLRDNRSQAIVLTVAKQTVALGAIEPIGIRHGDASPLGRNSLGHNGFRTL
jgi:hypothetical protein